MEEWLAWSLVFLALVIVVICFFARASKHKKHLSIIQKAKMQNLRIRCDECSAIGTVKFFAGKKEHHLQCNCGNQNSFSLTEEKSHVGSGSGRYAKLQRRRAD